jgi:hypothetical protein
MVMRSERDVSIGIRFDRSVCANHSLTHTLTLLLFASPFSFFSIELLLLLFCPFSVQPSASTSILRERHRTPTARIGPSPRLPYQKRQDISTVAPHPKSGGQ